MHHNREQDFGFDGGNAFGDEDFGGGKKVRWRGRILSWNDVRQEFEPEYTDEKRNEWLKWIDERSKRYSIEPVIINRFPRVFFNSDGKSSDCYIYSTEYGTYEVPEKFVESSVAKPVDVIMRARGRRFPLVITDPEWGYQKIIAPTDLPKKESDPPVWTFFNQFPLSSGDPPKKDVFYLMELFVNHNADYQNFCEDLYEKYDDIGYSDFRGREIWNIINFNYARWPWMNQTKEIIWFDEFTGELCLELMPGRGTLGKNFERISF